jgi:hypothetical protein
MSLPLQHGGHLVVVGDSESNMVDSLALLCDELRPDGLVVERLEQRSELDEDQPDFELLAGNQLLLLGLVVEDLRRPDGSCLRQEPCSFLSALHGNPDVA